MRGLRIILGFIGVLGLAANAAAETSFYVGGGVGLYNAQVDSPVTAAQAASVGVNCFTAQIPTQNECSRNFEDSAATWALFGGWQVMDWLALQVDYDWYNTAQSQIPINSSRNYTVSGDAWEVALRPSYSFGEHIEVYSRLGWNWYNIDGKYQFIKGNSDSNDAAMVAGGLAFKFTPEFSLQAEYEYVDVDNGALNAATLRAVYHFKR